MAKKHNTFGDSWFDISKYDQVKNFDIHDWHYQLTQRLFIDKFFDVVSLASLNEAVKELIALIKDNPILSYDKPEVMGSTVRETRYVDLILASYDNEKLKDIFGIPAGEIFDEVGKTSVIPQYFFRAGLNKALLTIDICATDEQLINDFKQWLKNHRTVSGYKVKAERSNAKKYKAKRVESKRFDENDFNKWSSYKILAYLDLTLIAKAENKKLTYADLGEKLYLDLNLNDAERIKDTIKPLAEMLLHVNTLNELSSQAKEMLHKM